MKKHFFFAVFLCGIVFCATAQIPQEYVLLIEKADSLLKTEQYAGAAEIYSQAFKSYGWRGFKDDRYKAARAWSMASVPDSAFFNLFRITEALGFNNLKQLEAEQHFQGIRQHPRWPELAAKVKANMPSMPALAALLDSIHDFDQRYRLLLGDTEKKYGRDSKEMGALWQKINFHDSINTLQVSRILDTKGWLSPKEVGENGNSALFLVIQHADITIQQKYLPKLREAVKNNKARGRDLALLEDRVALGEGRKQVYGSQISRDRETGIHKISPIEDPFRVDERRASVGLPPLKDYVARWGLVWDEAAAKKMEEEK